MATTQPAPATAGPQTATAGPQTATAGPQTAPRAVSAAQAETHPAQALVPVLTPQQQEVKAQLGGAVARLPVELDVVVPVRDFRVRNLLTLEPGTVIPSQWSYGDDVPLAAGDVQLAWSEFEVLETHLAVRITRLP